MYQQLIQKNKSKPDNARKFVWITPIVILLVSIFVFGNNSVIIDPFEKHDKDDFKRPESSTSKIDSLTIPKRNIVSFSNSVVSDESVSFIITRSNGLIEETIPTDDGKILEKRITIPDGATYSIPFDAKK